ncbi:aminoglycoside phosphotransferase family protein [Devosia sp. PTR5]|uniref:Aminoglycoside phosphotransferase family protein n=1 Tax=Devosia oryzisoli TaxID=2774138 RepID=A0A927IRS8_9HYPH|nr:aminoglycoside phosphotransferase family protein [Devosia oryzisoli]MBD8064729.1 aminoglycoside phosphotransferase family protein [Devosia oryzisoli]
MDAKPDEGHARTAARQALGWPRVDSVRRFGTGTSFFVFEVVCGTQRAVVRMGIDAQRSVLKDGLELWQRLAPLDLPLPRIFADGTDQPLPFTVLERLPGVDLGAVIHTLGDRQLRHIAAAVAEAQHRVGSLGAGSSFGYAARPGDAPFARWDEVVAANLDRSRRRLAQHAVFSPDHADRLQAKLDDLRPAMARLPALPFLHDTTTKNVIIAPQGHLSGIVDVDDLCYGDPRYVIGLSRAALISLGQPFRYADFWLAASGLCEDTVSAFYTPLFLLDFMSEHGAAFNGNQPVSDAVERARIEGQFLAALEALS